MDTPEKTFAKKWLEKAEHDFRHAGHSLEFGDLDWAQLACQQAAEKALKAVCIRTGLGLVKTHELSALARKLGAPRKIIEQCALLNSFYTAPRYPDIEGLSDESTQESATHDALSAAREVLAWSKTKI
ncbi:MAG TPA: HEPN domain-containing protein [Candidatus Norongarragalinales archaeon]|nr:HEPN domain-containing protein [Candidatus Norongarragalinales archaeon]